MRVAILPAAGRQERMGGHVAKPKQLLRLSDGRVIDYALKVAEKAQCWPHIILRPGKPEISFHVSYEYAQSSFSYETTLSVLDGVAALRPVFGECQILYMQPDTLFQPLDIGALMLRRMTETDSFAFLGLFETDKPQKFGMCELKGGYPFGYVTGIVDKPGSWPQGCGVAWGVISWSKPFWDFIERADRSEGDHFSNVLNRAIDALGPIPYVMLHEYRDIGTPQDYQKAVAQGW